MSIKINNLSHTYNANTPFAYQALTDINLSLPEGKMIAIVGATGSGKTTLVQHFNALLRPTEGEITINEHTIVANEKTKGLKNLRKEVGLVFQFPEYQLFEETVIQDVAFGPKNFGVSEDDALKVAAKYLTTVGISEDYYQRSPLDLSGGQKRRVAIAGILALESSTLVLDEPTAGLDPQGAAEMMRLFKKLNEDEKRTVIIVTHDMEHVLNYCDEVIVIGEGRIKGQFPVGEFFNQPALLDELAIELPQVINLREQLIERGFKGLSNILTLEELVKAIAQEVVR